MHKLSRTDTVSIVLENFSGHVKKFTTLKMLRRRMAEQGSIGRNKFAVRAFNWAYEDVRINVIEFEENAEQRKRSTMEEQAGREN